MNRKNSRILFWSVIGLVIAASVAMIVYVAKNGNRTTPATDGDLPPVAADEWVRGNADASLTLVEYSDFQCPACLVREPILQELMEEFGSRIRFVYREFPLRTIHANAQIAAQAAEAAGLQGKFWEMHDSLFSHHSEWEKLSNDEAAKAFRGYAQDLGLDLTKYDTDFDSDEVKDAIEDDVQSALDAGVYSTPTFFLNGELVTADTTEYESFRQAIREALTTTK